VGGVRVAFDQAFALQRGQHLVDRLGSEVAGPGEVGAGQRPGGGYRSDAKFLEAPAEAEGDVAERLREVEKLQEQLAAAMDIAQAALQAAYAMPVKAPCDGCHGIKEAATLAALQRIRLCEAAAEVLDKLAQRRQAALDRLQQIPYDLGEVYEPG